MIGKPAFAGKRTRVLILKKNIKKSQNEAMANYRLY